MQGRYKSVCPLPGLGQPAAVASGVYWLRLPLPVALYHINLYLLEDDDGCYLVDTGIYCSATRDYLALLLNSGLNGKPLSPLWFFWALSESLLAGGEARGAWAN